MQNYEYYNSSLFRGSYTKVRFLYIVMQWEIHLGILSSSKAVLLLLLSDTLA